MSRYFLVLEPQLDYVRSGKVTLYPLVQVYEFDTDLKHGSMSPKNSVLKQLQTIAKAMQLSVEIDGQLKPTTNHYALRIEADGMATDLRTGEQFKLPIEKLKAKSEQSSRSILRHFPRVRRQSMQFQKSKTSVRLPIIEKALNTSTLQNRNTPSSARIPISLDFKQKHVRRTRVQLQTIERKSS
mmetsp:Transcript_25137/g.44041  ORF Transcript_25137/g.44041 Transcript_25137/m.44041 type:complete len:184 (-) Transcript_25137:670-1221(-)